jgi:hypothetical protein
MAYTQQTPIGTPDVNLITKTLASLQPDSALQQYAALHKNNPYILSLAKSESDRRRSLRTAAQGNPGQMPTVADREIAGMATPVMTGSGGTLQTGYGGPVTTGMASGGLPEDQGIAQLPTPNMQRMADGGIAGYEDDEEGMATGGMGGMFNFAQQSEPVVRMAGGGHIPRYQGTPRSIGGDGSVVSSNPMFNIPNFQAVTPRETFTQEGSPENQTMFERLSGYLGDKKKQATLSEIAYRIHTGIATPEEKAFYQAEMTKQPVQKPMGAPKDVVNPDEILMATEKAGRNKAATADKAEKDKLPVPPVVNLPTSYKAPKAPTIDDATALGEKFSSSKERIGDIKRTVLQEQMDATNAKEKSIAALDAFNKKQGPAFAGYEQTLKKEELQDATDKEKAGLMALFKGFLGVAAGESPNAAVNFAKGSLLGVEDYSTAMKELKKSAKERNKEMQYIEQARRAEDRGNFDKAQSFEEKAETSRQASARFGIAAINDITNAGAKISSDIFNTISSNTSREKIAGMGEAAANARLITQLNAPDPQSKFYGNIGGGDPKKGLEFYAGVMGPEGKGIQTLLKEYSGFAGEALLKSLETSKDPADRAKAATIRQLQKEQLASGFKPVNVASALP